MNKLSVVLAVYNEQDNIRKCLDSIKDIASEIVIVDGGSTDSTIEIAGTFNARIIRTGNPPIFHINKQKALEAATNEWILQLDADEVVTPKLAKEIITIINLDDEQIADYQKNLKNRKLFKRHQYLLNLRDGIIGDEKGKFCAFFIPRLNFFLSKYLKYGGVYPDGVIRLIKKDKARFPCKSVHEQIEVFGKVGWLENDLIHIADPTFERYLVRNNRYINLMVDEMKNVKLAKSVIQGVNYFLIKPVWWFFMTQILNKGILDGVPGVIFSFFSALRFPKAYFRYLRSK